MSDNENCEESDEKPFYVEIAKQGRAGCKKCKEKCPSGELRIAKLVSNPFGSGKVKQWYHIPCIFEAFLGQKPATKRIDDSEEIDGFEKLNGDQQKELQKRIDECEGKMKEKWGDKLPKKEPKSPKKVTKPALNDSGCSKSAPSKDLPFRDFRRLIAEVTNESSYLEKTAVVKRMFTKGVDGNGFKGDVIQWCRLLLPGVVKRIYNLKSKQLVKLFSKIFETDQEEMLEHLEQGDVGETIQHFHENSILTPSKKSLVTVQDVDCFLEELSCLTKEDEQAHHFKKFLKKCTSNDLKTVIRLVKHDLRMNAGAKHILEAVHPSAYEAFQSSRDIKLVLERFIDGSTAKTSGIQVMTPVLPMLAEACKSVEQAMKKCPNGMYSEIKYDGERVQVHKEGNEFKYFSRSLKPVMPHKVSHFKNYIPKAFPHAKDLILDAEVLMIDSTGKPLPFGTLGVHKKAEFQDANVCLFVFDCIYFKGETLTRKPIKERRNILMDNMTEIPNHVMFSEVEIIHKPKDLTHMIAKVLKLGLEGLVLKDLNSVYEPGKRHWLKVKKDYLCDGAMADSADLVVLGAWFGTGKKGGMMSVFLMGCYDEVAKKFVTVTKVHTGHDDKTLERLQKELEMVKISCDFSKVPSWLRCTRTMVPDFVAKDPKNQPVWEITGAEFTQHDVHTANGISIRFPRVTKIRDDKTWTTATSLKELKDLFKNKDKTDFKMLLTKHGDLDSFVEKQSDKTSDNEEKQANEDETSEVKQMVVEEKQLKVRTKAEKKDSYQQESTSKGGFDVWKKIKKEEKSSDDETDDEKQAEVEKLPKKKIKDEFNTDDPVDTKKEYTKDLELFSGSYDPAGSKKGTKRPPEDPPASKTPKRHKLKPEKDLFPIFFSDVRVFLMDSSDESDDLLRHFLAYGGDVLKNEDREKATHVVHFGGQVSDAPKSFSSSARHVVIDWVKDSIGHQKVQDTRPYSVVWAPC